MMDTGSTAMLPVTMERLFVMFTIAAGIALEEVTEVPL